MKTRLLFLLVAFSTINLMAATTFNYSTSVADQTIDGITVQLRKGSGQNDPAAVTNSTVRLYANNTITIQGQNIQKISLTFAKNPDKAYASMSVDVGNLTSGGTSTSATDTRTDIWMGSSNTINFTIGSSGQRVLKTIVIEIGSGNEGGGGSGNEGGGGSGENKVITYTATSKLSGYNGSLSVGKTTFGPAITSHTFSNGTGTITCSGEITTIGEYAFEYCSGLTSVTIPNSVKTIGKHAFDYCSGLTSILIGNSVTTIGEMAFYYCKGLASIIIPNSVKTIEGLAFYDCTGLTSITIGNSITAIGIDAFSSCSGLTKTNYTGTIADWCKIKFSNSYANPIYYSYNFYINDVEVKDLVIPEGVDTIGNYAFGYCRGLTSVTIPNSVKTIGDCAFYDCSGLTSITIGNSVTKIGDWAFYYCSGLTSITIPNSVTTIGDDAFEYCTALKTVYNISNLNITKGSMDYGYVAYYADNVYNGILVGDFIIKQDTILRGYVGNATDIIIPDGITQIVRAFSNCSGLTSVTIPNSVTTIGEGAFIGCSGLTSVTIPNSVTTIGDYAFQGCRGLTSVTIPNSVKTIGNSAFSWCTGLTSITCYATNPPTCGSSCFSNVDMSIPVYVPAQSINAYKQAYKWKDFENILPISDSLKDLGIYTMTTSAIEGTISCNNLSANSPSCAFFAVPTSWNNPFAWVWNENENGHWEPLYYIADNCYAYIMHDYDQMLVADFPINYTPSGNVWDDAVIRQTNDMYLFPGERYTIDEASFISTHQYFLFYSESKISLTVTPNSGYDFVRWSDGNTDNPRSVVMTRNMTFTAQFAKNTYTITATGENGIVTGGGDYTYQSTCTLTATANNHYHFVKWSDGNTSNPRTITVTGDKTFKAIFAKITSGKCGDNLTWNYNDGVLVISGTGAMYDYTQGTSPWILFQDSINSLIINNGCTSIGNFAFYGLSNKDFKTIDLPNGIEQIGQYAFANCEYLKNLYLGLSLEKIAANAFANDERLLYITCYAIEPPLLDESAFINYDAYLSVPCESQADYKVAKGWKLFNKENVSCIGAEEKPVTTDEVTVVPTDNQATFTWPQNDQAAGYSIEITKDGVVFCTLKFNAQGQLTGIAFAPGRGNAREMAAAEMTASGWQFTVTGLNQNSKYGYTLDVTNASQQSIKHYEGEFTTTGATGLEWLTVDNAQCTVKKMIIDNQLFIFRGNKIYNAVGVLMK